MSWNPCALLGKHEARFGLRRRSSSVRGVEGKGSDHRRFSWRGNTQRPEGRWKILSMGTTCCTILEDYLAALCRTSGEEPCLGNGKTSHLRLPPRLPGPHTVSRQGWGTPGAHRKLQGLASGWQQQRQGHVYRSRT